MFDTLGFLWLHYDSPPYLLYLLEKLVDGLSDERVKPPRSTATSALYEVIGIIGTNCTPESAIKSLRAQFLLKPAVLT